MVWVSFGDDRNIKKPLNPGSKQHAELRVRRAAIVRAAPPFHT